MYRLPNYRDKRSCFLNNLIDAGCEEELIKKCEMLKNNHQTNELILTLTKHKQKLLKILHENANQIDCLDFLIYEIKNENKIIEERNK